MGNASHPVMSLDGCHGNQANRSTAWNRWQERREDARRRALAEDGVLNHRWDRRAPRQRRALVCTSINNDSSLGGLIYGQVRYTSRQLDASMTHLPLAHLQPGAEKSTESARRFHSTNSDTITPTAGDAP